MSATKGKARTRVLLETDSEMSSSGSSRNSAISSLNLPAPMLESQPGEAPSSGSCPRGDGAGATWAPPMPPNASPEHHTVRRAKSNRRVTEADACEEVGSKKEGENDSKEYWREGAPRASTASKERSNPGEANKKKRSGIEDDHSPFTSSYPRKDSCLNIKRQLSANGGID